MAILFFGTVMLAKAGAIEVPVWSVWLGNISYSLYLVHVYVFEISQRIVGAMPIGPGWSMAVLLVMRPVAAVLCAWAIFRCVEAPLCAWARARLLHARMPRGNSGADQLAR